MCSAAAVPIPADPGPSSYQVAIERAQKLVTSGRDPLGFGLDLECLGRLTALPDWLDNETVARLESRVCFEQMEGTTETRRSAEGALATVRQVEREWLRQRARDGIEEALVSFRDKSTPPEAVAGARTLFTEAVDRLRKPPVSEPAEAAIWEGKAIRALVWESGFLPTSQSAAAWLRTSQPASERHRETEWDEGPNLFDAVSLSEPEWVQKPLIVRGNYTVLSGLAKIGKSTLLAQCAADAVWGALPGSPFGDASPAVGETVLLYSPDQDASLSRRQMAEAGLCPGDLVHIRSYVRDPLGAIERAIKAHPDAGLVIIDSLIEYARRVAGDVPDSGDAASWGEVGRPLSALAHDTGVAIVVLHHARKSDGRLRDSGEIEAAADIVVEMLRKGSHPTRRTLEVRGRYGMETINLDFREGRYVRFDAPDIEDLEQDVRLRVVRHLIASPHETKGRVRDAVSGHNPDIDQALDALIAEGVIRNEGTATKWDLVVTEAASEWLNAAAAAEAADTFEAESSPEREEADDA